ncbi:hypothetical protein B0H13DRAFT_1856118 [Mycena leptocephala]|nr:hypothetical protein B0H13DRAFT_1856118 [Mycena leptocephala]
MEKHKGRTWAGRDSVPSEVDDLRVVSDAPTFRFYSLRTANATSESKFSGISDYAGDRFEVEWAPTFGAERGTDFDSPYLLVCTGPTTASSSFVSYRHVYNEFLGICDILSLLYNLASSPARPDTPLVYLRTSLLFDTGVLVKQWDRGCRGKGIRKSRSATHSIEDETRDRNRKGSEKERPSKSNDSVRREKRWKAGGSSATSFGKGGIDAQCFEGPKKVGAKRIHCPARQSTQSSGASQKRPGAWATPSVGHGQSHRSGLYHGEPRVCMRIWNLILMLKYLGVTGQHKIEFEDKEDTRKISRRNGRMYPQK